MTKYPTNEDIIENMTEAVIAIEPSDEMEVAIFNQGAERITEMSRDKVSGSALREIFSRDPWLVELLRRRSRRQDSTANTKELFTGGSQIPSLSVYRPTEYLMSPERSPG